MPGGGAQVSEVGGNGMSRLDSRCETKPSRSAGVACRPALKSSVTLVK